MKRITFLFITILMVAFSANAQSVSTGNSAVLCTDYNRITGEPMGVYTIWEIPSDGYGGYVYLIYKQAKVIKKPLKLTIDKLNSAGNYEFYSTYFFENDVKSGLNWAMYDVNFTEEGSYKLSVYGKGKAPMASTFTEINFITTEIESVVDDASDEVIDEYYSDEDLSGEYDTYYYENTVVTFGTAITNGSLIGESNTFKLKGKQKELVAKIEMDDPLELSEVWVSVYYGDAYDEEVSSESFTVADKAWNWINVPVTVYKKGKYVVDFYNQNDVYINTGYFEIE
jgi:hypothetical protein